MPPSASVDAPKATRRRGAKLMKEIYQSTLSELADNGFEHLTFEKIAAAVGTGRGSLYRRWSTPEELLLDALADSVVGYGAPVVPDKGDVRSDLIAILVALAESLDRPHGRAMLLVLAHRATRPELYALVQRTLIKPYEATTMHVLETAAERGEVNPDVINARVTAIGSRLVISEYNLSGRIDRDEVIAIVDEIIMPIIASRRPLDATAPQSK